MLNFSSSICRLGDLFGRDRMSVSTVAFGPPSENFDVRDPRSVCLCRPRGHDKFGHGHVFSFLAHSGLGFTSPSALHRGSRQGSAPQSIFSSMVRPCHFILIDGQTMSPAESRNIVRRLCSKCQRFFRGGASRSSGSVHKLSARRFRASPPPSLPFDLTR
jgi:hypothetical protein